MTSMDIKAQEKLFGLIKRSLWNTDTVEAVDWAIFEEMKKQALVALPAGILSRLDMPEELRQAWKMAVYQQISYNANYLLFQAELPVTVPYAILKGSSTAKYYPHPEYRAMGDIDIMPRREDFQAACGMLLQNGFQGMGSEEDRSLEKHCQFFKDGIEVEVHAYFAHQNDAEKAKRLDDLILDHISPSHELPDFVNGIVLLEHINHHMEDGLGLRQIIDWMMFVDRCLPDEEWQSFQPLVQKLGLEKLALGATRMCELYLGLPERKWCAGVDQHVCEQLMEYALENGNFGKKKELGSRSSVRFLSSTRTLKGAISYLQGRGVVNWKAAQKYRVLRPFAWLYQAGKYISQGLNRENPLGKLKKELTDGKSRNDMLDALGVTREEKGIAAYKVTVQSRRE